MNELLCMNYGADDFIAKPFNPQILLAHVEAVLKRTNSHGQKEERIDCGGFWLDLSRGTVKDGVREIELTKNETRILCTLARNRGKIVSKWKHDGKKIAYTVEIPANASAALFLPPNVKGGVPKELKAGAHVFELSFAD